MARESKFQSDLIKELRELLPGCAILKNDANHLQGVPDLLILYKDRWALLEVKRSESEPRQPNQEYYVDWFNKMSYSAFIYPENKEDILHEVQQALRSRRTTRRS